MNTPTVTFAPNDDDRWSPEAWLVLAAFVVVALVFGAIQNADAIDAAMQFVGNASAGLAQKLALSFWTAGLLAVATAGVSLACIGSLYAAMGQNGGMTRLAATWTKVGAVVGALAYVVALALFEHTFAFGAVLGGIQDTLVIASRLPAGIGAVMAGVVAVVLCIDI